MSTFFTVDDIGLYGLHVPFSSAELTEAEFVDDNTLYLHGGLDNLHKVELPLSMFWKAFGPIVTGINRWANHIHYLGSTISTDLSY